MADNEPIRSGADIYLRHAAEARNEAAKLVAKGEWALASIMRNAALQYEHRAKKAQDSEQ